ncbi:MAG: hypothetical protein PVH18_06195 [Chloroflexota bacterium]|jgi:hypothetical protein
MNFSHNSRIITLLLFLLILLVIVVSGRRLANANDQDVDIVTETAKEPITFLPLVKNRLSPLPPPLAHTTAAPLNVQELTESIPDSWQLGLNKIGFHTGPNANEDGLVDWMNALDGAGIPFFLKTVDHAGTVYVAQEMMRASGVPHTLVFRTTTAGRNDGFDYDVPNYNLAPEEAAQIHWQAHKDKFPPELDPQYVWIETVNEVDRGRSEWLAEFALATAKMALEDGYRWAAFGWSSGEPEKADWASPKMLDFLRFAAQHPNDIAIALHEYSYTVNDVGNIYPYLIGRVQALFEVCDSYNIRRPTILITEWGWTYDKVPVQADAMNDIRWASYLYAAYPNIKGAAIWYLGGGFGGIRHLTQPLIAPVTDFTLSNYYWVALGQGATDPSLFPPPAPRPALDEPSPATASEGTRRIRPAPKYWLMETIN